MGDGQLANEDISDTAKNPTAEIEVEEQETKSKKRVRKPSRLKKMTGKLRGSQRILRLESNG